MMWWNGEPLPTPSPGISFEERIVEGTNSGQTLGGSYSKKIIARKEDVRVTWEGLTAEESAAIGKIDASTYGMLTYYSPAKGKFLTKTMHVESHTQDINEADIQLGRFQGDISVTVQFREK